jgi:hypothetical protein
MEYFEITNHIAKYNHLYFVKEHNNVKNEASFCNVLFTKSNHFRLSIGCCHSNVAINANIFDDEFVQENGCFEFEDLQAWNFYKKSEKEISPITKDEFITEFVTYQKVKLYIWYYKSPGRFESLTREYCNPHDIRILICNHNKCIFAEIKFLCIDIFQLIQTYNSEENQIIWKCWKDIGSCVFWIPEEVIDSILFLLDF